MTTEEMFQLLINEMKEMRGDIKELRADVNRLETKIDSVQSTQDNMRLGIRNLRCVTDEFRNEMNDKFDRQAKSVHYLDKSVAHFHERINHVEEELTLQRLK
ncbi:MAG: hypothetical protein FD167_4632, partial [bacterium]